MQVDAEFIRNLNEPLKKIVQDAGNAIMEVYKKDDFESVIKSDGSPVTEADNNANKIIIDALKEITPKVPIVSEETYKKESDIPKTPYWLVDPLDGTKDFLQRTGNYAMHLSLNYKNKPYLGVVLVPSKDELWISDGRKVWCESRFGSKKIFHLSKKKSLQEMTLVASKNHRNKTLELLIDKMNFKNVLSMGSIGCKIASIIRGESDIYISLTTSNKSSPKDWDFAAPEIILKTAGGAITKIPIRNPNFLILFIY